MYWWHHADMDNRMYCNLSDGKKISMPRYYKDKIYSDQERLRIAFMQLQLVNKQMEKEMEELGDDYFRIKNEQRHAAFKKMAEDAKKPEKNRI